MSHGIWAFNFCKRLLSLAEYCMFTCRNSPSRITFANIQGKTHFYTHHFTRSQYLAIHSEVSINENRFHDIEDILHEKLKFKIDINSHYSFRNENIYMVRIKMVYPSYNGAKVSQCLCHLLDRWLLLIGGLRGVASLVIRGCHFPSFPFA